MGMSFSWTQCDEECIAGVTYDCCEHSDCGESEYCYVYTGWLGNENRDCISDNFEDGCCYYNDSVDSDCDGDADLLDCPTDCFAGVPGPFSIGIISEENGLRDGPDYMGGIIYYPIDAEGPLPTIVLVPGNMGFISSIEAWGPYLASFGIVTLFVNVNWVWQSSLDRAAALLDGLVTIQAENDRIFSPLFGNLDLDKLGVGGYSKGAGGAMIAAVIEPSIKTVLALTPWIEDVTPEFSNFDAAVLYISGELDENAPNDEYSNVFYEYTPESTNKLLFEVAGGSHSIAMNPFNDYYIGIKALYWLENFLIDDPTNCNLLIEVPPTASQFLTNVDCPALGDLNSDDEINVLDVVMIMDMILNNSEYNTYADFNEDDAVNVLDVVIIVNFILSA